jgi:hypothetical protein
MREVAQKLCLQLKSEHLDAPLSLQIVKNLLYIGKSFYEASVPSAKEEAPQGIADMDSDDEDVTENEREAKAHNPLPWLFSKLSYQVRSAHIGRRNRSFSVVGDQHRYATPSAVTCLIFRTTGPISHYPSYDGLLPWHRTWIPADLKSSLFTFCPQFIGSQKTIQSVIPIWVGT